jgi:phosphoglycerate dehydrogenase-like enzyme
MSTDPDVVVLRQNVHGIPPGDYVQALEARLLDALRERGVAVTNASGVHAPNVSEYALGAVLTFARGFLESRRRQRRREWRSHQVHELAGSTVAVVGMGAIGQSVVDRLDAFDVHTVGVRYTPEKGGPTDEVYGYDDVSEALVGALRANSVRGAALDVTDPEPLPEDHPLWGFENVLVTPHNAGHTPEYFERLADWVVAARTTAGMQRAIRRLKNAPRCSSRFLRPWPFPRSTTGASIRTISRDHVRAWSA